jgi:hypothetical protein
MVIRGSNMLRLTPNLVSLFLTLSISIWLAGLGFEFSVALDLREVLLVWTIVVSPQSYFDRRTNYTVGDVWAGKWCPIGLNSDE